MRKAGGSYGNGTAHTKNMKLLQSIHNWYRSRFPKGSPYENVRRCFEKYEADWKREESMRMRELAK